MTADAPSGLAPRFRPRTEILLVLGLSLGQSAIYSVLSIIRSLTQGPLNQQTTTINNSVTPERPWLDLAYQVAGIAFPLVPVGVALYLLWQTGDRARIGFDLRRPGFDLGRGFFAAAIIGIPGLVFYVAARELGFNTNVAPANLAENWWTIPVLAGYAVMNGVLEEVIMLGFLFVRFEQLKLGPWTGIVISALIRGSYHLYQGFGGFVGNVVMGLVFGYLYKRWGRVMPLVVAHTILDLVSFIGYALVAPYTDWF
ncbi:MAG TPA: CPBP family intramembrane metalloprotease [Propioniciclava sp.]|uniref:CPBP family intramembrane glutamic endopeptidase n=1 Tax=Propioniciclava sp. TaxID=2038686 RepID=UPI002C514C93|nr:CPBP family intramembrane glutamic endopeptidase [Propioniciclava sp.]HRL49343.1 CPBP family intramembrane metalloprotease [Propioniciclava sp.]HRL79889.1 CPBP family intramembrane metalloprotease [Propioniciclava sp.]